jgi:ABC-type uncharacterized transport system ATPase subunit
MNDIFSLGETTPYIVAAISIIMIAYIIGRKYSKKKTRNKSAAEQNLQNSNKLDASIVETVFVNQKITRKTIVDHQFRHIDYETYSTSKRII